MQDLSKYSACESLRDGRPLLIRALRPDDRESFLAAVGGLGQASLYRRFFSAKREFTEKEKAYYVDVDFLTHVALIAMVEEDGKPVITGAGRYIVAGPRQGEVAFAVADRYQGYGIGAHLMRHLIMIARQAGLQELIADVLPDNRPMLGIFEKSGLPMHVTREVGDVHVTLRL